MQNIKLPSELVDQIIYWTKLFDEQEARVYWNTLIDYKRIYSMVRLRKVNLSLEIISRSHVKELKKIFVSVFNILKQLIEDEDQRWSFGFYGDILISNTLSKNILVYIHDNKVFIRNFEMDEY